jgi:hypothetical protein
MDMLNRSPGASAPIVELPLGTIVYDVEGAKVGKVTFSTLHTGYFMVEQGWLLTRDLYLPPEAIQLREADWIKLRLTREELKQDRWKSPPPEHLQGASPRAMAEEGAAIATDAAERGG